MLDRIVLIGLSLTAVGAGQGPTRAPLVERLPAATVAAIEVADAPALARATLALVGGLPELPARARAGIALATVAVRAATGASGIADAVESVAPGGICVALVVDRGGPSGVAIVHQPERSERAESWLDSTSRAWARSDDLLLVAEDRERLGRLIAAVEGRADRVAPRAWRTDAPARAFVDVSRVRALAPGSASVWDRTPSSGRFPFGPYAALLDAANFVELGVAVDVRGIRVDALVDGDWVGAPTAGALIASGRRERPLPPVIDGSVAVLALDRSVAGALRDVKPLFGEAVAARLQAGLTIADTLVGGSFTDDLLPTLG